MNSEQLDYNRILGSSQEKSDTWAAFLGRFTWFWFCTFTFRDNVHPERADKLFHVLMCMMNRRLYGRRWYKKGRCVRWVRAIEMQKRDVLHYHALIGGQDAWKLDPIEFQELWYDMAGIARIGAVESSGAALAYVSKYVSKGGQIDLGGPMEDLADPNLSLFDVGAIGLTTPELDRGHAGQVARIARLRVPGARGRRGPSGPPAPTPPF